MPNLKKTDIALNFEAGAMLDFRKLLFRSGLCPQQFFTYIVDQAILNDDRLLELISEARDYKTKSSLRKSDNTLDADALYDLIEQGD